MVSGKKSIVTNMKIIKVNIYFALLFHQWYYLSIGLSQYHNILCSVGFYNHLSCGILKYWSYQNLISKIDRKKILFFILLVGQFLNLIMVFFIVVGTYYYCRFYFCTLAFEWLLNYLFPFFIVFLSSTNSIQYSRRILYFSYYDDDR